MKKKDSLFVLIKSLTKTEKRYFKHFFQRGKEKNYLRLFDFIDRQIHPNEAEIKDHFKNEALVRQLPVSKHYLRQLILKSLRAYHAKISKGAELRALLSDIEILFMKALYTQCHEIIEKGIALAERYQKQPELLLFYGWKRRLLLENPVQSENWKALKHVRDVEHLAIKKTETLNAYWALMIRSLQRDPTESEIENEANSLLQHPLLQNPSNANTIKARVLFHHIGYAENVFQNKPDEAIKHLEQLVLELESTPEMIEEEPATYFTALTNQIGLHLWTKNHDQVEHLLQKARAIPKTYHLYPHAPLTIRLMLRTYNIELEFYRDRREWEKGILLLEQEVIAYITAHESRLPDDYRFLLFYQFAYLYFMDQNFKKALYWLNEIFRYPFGSFREDIQSFAQILHLILHFDLGNISTLKYAVERCRRFLKKKRNLYAFEKVLLAFFSKTCMVTKEKYPQLFLKLQSDLFSDSNASETENILDYLDFKDWISRHIEKQNR